MPSIMRNNPPVAARGGGHNVAGFSTCDDGIVISVGMKGISVDAAAPARAQGGLTWGNLTGNAAQLATTGGLVTTTGIAGLPGGGIGWLMRWPALIDNLLRKRWSRPTDGA
jgi:FAD/FMN-containing dehydrogenase